MSSPIFLTTYKVYINHTDAGGIVYHANHLTFFENCRRDWLTTLGFDGYFFVDDNNPNHKTHFVVNHAEVSYKLPLMVDDALIVTIDDITIKAASIVIHQCIYKNQDDFNANKVASMGKIILAHVKNTHQGIFAQRLPKNFITQISKLT